MIDLEDFVLEYEDLPQIQIGLSSCSVTVEILLIDDSLVNGFYDYNKRNWHYENGKIIRKEITGWRSLWN